jgi:uncharacterized protein (DUF362 family)
MNPIEDLASSSSITRRTFGRDLAFAAAGAVLSYRQISAGENSSPVALVQGTERLVAIELAIESLGGIDCQGKDVFLKGNFNSPHPFPATTHPDSLTKVAEILRKNKCSGITLVERSGMGSTGEIWQKLGIVDLAKRLGIRLLALDELPPGEWRKEELPRSHWKRGVEVPRFVTASAFWVQISNLKTHRFGGRISASLKNAVGLIAKHSHSAPRYNYMAELHASPDQRLMIAEINQLYAPALVLMDAMEVFTEGGPESGELASPGVVAASRDRVALDAVGMALLRLQTAAQPGRLRVYEEDQIKRAAELGLGATSPEEITFITGDRSSDDLSQQVKAVLSQAPGKEKKP